MWLPAEGHSHLVERRVAQQCTRRAVTTERMPVDADPLQVDAPVAFAQLAQRGHMVIELHIGAVQEAAVMECLVAAAGAAASMLTTTKPSSARLARATGFCAETASA